MKKKSFIALFDILGYKAILNNSNIDDVFKRYTIFKEEIEDYVEHINGVYSIGLKNHQNSKRVTMCIYADTLLFYTTDISGKNQGEIDYVFLEMLTASDFLFQAANKLNWPIRGVITVGELIHKDDIFVSKEIVDAHEMEKKQAWAGCWINGSCIENISEKSFCEHKSKNAIIEYDIPLTCGCYKHGHVFNWVTKDKMKICGITDSMSESDIEDVKAKYKNTTSFMDFIQSNDAYPKI